MRLNKIALIVFALFGIILVSGGTYYWLCRLGAFYISLADLRRKYVRPTSKFITLKGYELHYEDEGAGPVLVLLNGSFGNLMNWDGFTDEMKSHYRIIRMDVPPWGLSGDVSNDVAKARTTFSDIIKALLDDLKISHITLIGNSAGGTESYKYTSRYPQTVDFLIFTQTAAFVNNRPLPEPIATDINISDNILHHRSHLATRIYMKSLWGNKDLLTPKLIDEYYDMYARKPSPNLRALVGYPNKPDVIKADLAKITAPTFIIFGDKDYVLTLKDMETLKKCLSHAKVETAVLPGVGHYPQLEAPHAFAQVTRAYLTRHGEPGLN